jgi:uncharacterized protein (DUF1330 family)
MPAFAIGLYNIRDASWRPAYREVVDKLVARHGGTVCCAHNESLGST